MYINLRRVPFIPGILAAMIIIGGGNNPGKRLWPAAPVPGPEQAEQTQTEDKEDLLFQDIPVVITAARKEQPITEAPTTITVVSAEDIRYSGATTIPDVLRMVAGVDVMTITARDQQVGVRGFIAPVNNKLLVLVDGRSVYTDLYGLIFWDTFPVGLEEIQRIEVVKSPASSLYGANAYSGVINIISKSPQQLKGTTFRLTAGSQNSFIGSVIHAGNAAKKRINYKVSAEWDSTDGWNENIEAEKTREVLRANALLEFSIDEKTKLVLSGGRGHSKNRKMHSGEAIGPGLLTDYTDYFQFDVRSDNLEFRTFFKWEKPSAEWLLTGEKQDWAIATYDVEFLHSFNIGETHSLVWGVNYRHNRLKDNPFIIKDQQQNLWALFLEDELRISDKLRMTLGGRYDRHPLARGHFSPRGSIFYSPGKKHILRLSVARAFRNPSFVDSYLYLETPLSTPVNLPPPLPPLAVPYIYLSLGN
jgi:iron complex outermembrane receptor protein